MSAEVLNEVNYAAMVVKVPQSLRRAENSDRLYILDYAGLSVIVDSSWLDRAGEHAVIFPPESQISEGLAEYANLYAKQDLNRDQGTKGYLGKSRRVKAIRLRGNVSTALALPYEVVAEYASGASALQSPLAVWEHLLLAEAGTVLDTLDGVELCRKFVLPEKQDNLGKTQQSLAKALKRVDEARFPQHIETSHYLRNRDKIDDSDVVIVTQKLHGTSVRLGHVPVRRKLSWLDRLAKRVGIPVVEEEYAFIAGSRKVVKDPDNPNQNHFYSRDVWTEALDAWGRSIPKGFIVYGELVGFTGNGDPIQRGYTYEAQPNSMDLYVYRVAVTVEDGRLIDLSHDQANEFAAQHDMKVVPELWRGPHAALPLEKFTERNFYRDWVSGGVYFSEHPVALSPGGAGVDEGIVIRVDGKYDVADFYKHKNDSFLIFESKDLDHAEESGGVASE